jgi:ABC-type lipoprotein export system ATPase subunit
MSDHEPVLRLEEVTKRHGAASSGRAFALGPLSVEILRGTWTAFTGHSGAGKTTLLQLLCGLDRPDSGRVWMFGRDMTQASGAALSEIRREKLGIVYQHFHFIEHLPVWQNVTARLVPAGVSAKARRGRAEQILRELDLPGSLDRPLRDLSAGEQQRVALARAMVDRPEMLVGDEPTSNLDTKTGEIIIGRLRVLQQGGATIVLSTHDPSLLALADHRFELVDGRIAS